MLYYFIKGESEMFNQEFNSEKELTNFIRQPFIEVHQVIR